ncbi:MAG: VanW family protein [Clostridium sp.]|nr:VanW family protein [Clostridium sp.]
MSKQTNIQTKDEEIIEEQQIFNDAEEIITSACKDIEHQKKLKSFLLLLIPLFIFAILVGILSTVFALINRDNETIFSGISVQGIDVSNLTIDEAKKKVSSIIGNHISEEISLQHNDFQTVILPEQFGVSFDVDSAVEQAYSIGKSDSVIKNNYTILSLLLKNYNISPSINYDEDLLNSLIDSINAQLPDRVVNSGYSIDGTNLIITSGKDGILISSSDLKDEILSFLNDISSKNETINIPVNNVGAEPINLDAIYKDIFKLPVDASYTTNPYVVYPSSNGLDFAISMEEAKAIISNQQDEYTIPLKVTYPNVTTNQIGNEAFPDLLSQFSTSFTSSGYNRSNNIILSSAKLNGLVLMPGEEFSYNQAVGQRTRAAGFREAGAYSNGKVVQEVGGGICQVSSTLYNAVLYANLEIVERTNHYFNPGYVKAGLDATVSWGGPDFRFRNNRNYPIRIVTDTSGKKLKVYIYGLKTDDDCTVVLDPRYISSVPYKTTYQNDASLATGETRVISSGSNGCKTATYKYVYDKNGTLISSECISRDTYSPHNKVVAVGP